MSARKRIPVMDVDDNDSGDHTCDEELDTDEDSAGSLVDFVVDDDAPIELEDQGAQSDDGEVKEVELVESAVYVNGVRRSTRARKQVERYVDSDYEDLMCADADPDAVMESDEAEEEEADEDSEETQQSEDTSESSND